LLLLRLCVSAVAFGIARVVTLEMWRKALRFYSSFAFRLFFTCVSGQEKGARDLHAQQWGAEI